MKNHFLHIKLYSCIGLIIVSILVPLKVLAVYVDYGFYSENDIMFYDPSASEATDPNDPNNPNNSGEEIDLTCYNAVQIGEPGNKDVLSSIIDFYTGKGLSLMQAAVIAGNFQAESGFNVYNVNQSSGAYGLAQWYSANRRNGLFGSTTNECPNLQEQLSFSWVELTSGYSSTLTELKTLKNAADIKHAAMRFHRTYEVSEDSDDKAFAIRGGYAENIYNKYK